MVGQVGSLTRRQVGKRDRIEDWGAVERDIRAALVDLTRLDFRFHRDV